MWRGIVPAEAASRIGVEAVLSESWGTRAPPVPLFTRFAAGAFSWTPPLAAPRA